MPVTAYATMQKLLAYARKTVFREKIYKRSTLTPDRRAAMDGLLASNLIGLKLSEDLDIEQTRRISMLHTRPTDEEMAAAKKVEKIKVEGVMREAHAEPAAKEIRVAIQKTMLAELAEAPPEQEKKFPQNFAIVTAHSPIGNRTFIHGREIFSPEAAERFFADGGDRQHFPYEEFGEAAKQKIRALLSPESLPGRMLEYVTPQDMIAYFKHYLEWLREEIPDLKISNPPELTEDNYLSVIMETGRALEKQGIDLGETGELSFFPSESSIAKFKLKLRSFTEARLAEAFLELKAQDKNVPQLKPALAQHLEQHDHDPEIVSNFVAGTRALPEISGYSLADIIRTGLEKRVEERLRECAMQIANPYDPKFVEAEKIVGDVLVHSVQPRVLRNIQQRKSAILVSDYKNIGIFQGVLRTGGNEWLQVSGKYDPKFPYRADHAHDFVLLSAPHLNYTTLGITARHECEHHRDFTQSDVPPYATYYKHGLNDCIAEDQQHLQDTLELLERVTPESPASDIERVKLLAKKRGGHAEHNTNNIDATRRRLLRDVQDIRDVARMSFLVSGEETPSEHYNLGFAKRTEVPAVIEHMKGQYGSAFIQELMPRLYETVSFHRAQSNTLRD